jgi:hypothetical protein
VKIVIVAIIEKAMDTLGGVIWTAQEKNTIKMVYAEIGKQTEMADLFTEDRIAKRLLSGHECFNVVNMLAILELDGAMRTKRIVLQISFAACS